MIENFLEVKTYIEQNKNTEEIKNYLQGINNLSFDGVKNYLESDEQGKGYLQSYADSKVTKGIESFKQNNLSKLVDEEIRKRNPSTDPKDIEIQELKKQFETIQRESVKKDLELKTSKLISERNIPVEFLPFVIGGNEETTMSNLTGLEKVLGDYSKAVRGQILKDGAYTPRKNFDSNTTVNPYAKETRSLTKQMELEMSNPTLALQFRNQVNQ